MLQNGGMGFLLPHDRYRIAAVPVGPQDAPVVPRQRASVPACQRASVPACQCPPEIEDLRGDR